MKKKKQKQISNPDQNKPEICPVHGNYYDSCHCTPIHPNFFKLDGLIFDVDECLALNVDDNVPNLQQRTV